VERREASVPRHGTQGASQAPGVPRYVHAHGCSAEHPNVSRRSAHLSMGVSEAKRQSPDADMRARERDGLFDIVNIAIGRAVLSLCGSSPRKRGPLITGPCSWVLALAALGRDDGEVGWAKSLALPSPRGQRRGVILPTRTSRATRLCPPYCSLRSSPRKRDDPVARPNYRSPSSRRTPVASLPAARMRAIAASIGSNATAMWKALA
jgi:hypothetical protein